MDLQLVVEQGQTRTRTVRLNAPQAVIGRLRGCDLRIGSAEVSRRHCRLLQRDGYLTVEDLQSSNGTFLNGVAVRGLQVVRPGDRLRVGPVTFVVQYQPTPGAIDRLPEVEEVVEELPEVEEVVEELPLVEDEVPVVDAEAVLDDDPEGWQLPEAESLRDILTGLDTDHEPPRPQKRK
jgi:pSer/pThr/pTyr-binding forkhead associated (FHA) protein